MWDDGWYNRIIDSVSFSFAVIERIGYIYYYDREGEGTVSSKLLNKKAD